MRIKSLCLVAIASATALISCNNTVAISPVYLGVSISPRPSSIPVGATVVFTGTVSNNLSIPQWSFLDAADTNNPGSLTSVSGSTNQVLYTAPPTPPIYTGTTTGIVQGTVTLDVTTTSPAGTSIPVSGDSVSFAITAPSVTVSLAPTTANVALGGTAQFIGYAVGSVNNALTWQLSANGISAPSGGTLGAINTSGTYTAPTAMPMSGNTVTVTTISQADPTKTQSAVVILH